MKTKKSYYLITGGAGFIGSNLIETIVNNDDNFIVVIDNFSTGSRDNLPLSRNITVIEADISDSDSITSILNRYNFDYVFHLAAVASVQDSINDPIRTHSINFDSTLFLLEYFKEKSLKKFVFASSAAVYGNKPNLPCSENDPSSPISPYGIDKYASERFVSVYHSLFGMNTVSFRFFNVFGPRQNPKSPYSGVISIFMDRIINGNGSITIFGDGQQTRDFIYVKDLVHVLLYSCTNDRMSGECYNLGTEIESTLLELAESIASLSDAKVFIDYKEERPGDIKRSKADISKLRDAGYAGTFRKLKAGLSEYMDYNRSNT